ncbi:MBL fold metallo-hydrolase [Actinopolyspora halophila]|uniref:MBL fold metallo-hydrolase n=1 Tax=Actinopolyspora halophila TaxID=1850 RepID=UPI00037D6202|nr:MBL fold metallo-hydrolase [Actinopolyspora halophila]
MREHQPLREILERPRPFVAPDLRPTGLRLHPEQLGDGVYALLANQPPKDNNGVVFGRDAALVVDTGVTPTVGERIRHEASELTAAPIRYVANTTYHGDHTFGNTAFGSEVTILSSNTNRMCMDDLEREKRARSESMFGESSLDEVTTWRRPDIVFDRFLSVDLGNKTVWLWHFGPGNGAGDVLVHVPDEGVVWTGNFLVPAGMVPMVLIGDPWSYSESVRAASEQLDIDRIVPGHGFIAPARPAVEWMLDYLERLGSTVLRDFRAGKDVDRIMNEFTLPAEHGENEMVRALNDSFHRLNILTTYRRLGDSAERG